MRRLLAMLCLMLALGASRLSAQEETYKFDIGGQIGMAGYLGDASASIFSHPGFSGGVSFRYLPDARWAVRTLLNVHSLSGDTSGMDDVLPENREYSFKSTAYDLGGRIEFNFFSYGIGETYKKLRRWSPYLTLGIGVTLATCEGESNLGFNIPMGAGLKYKLRERWNLGIEFTMTKVFSDHVDGALSDLQQIKSSFLKNTDWYSNISVSLTYEFGKRCATCHYVD
ncbi:MAG: porin family protein [Bacteroidales bacterium]|nr:porin family protein [Bacteroidales bacterium]